MNNPALAVIGMTEAEFDKRMSQWCVGEAVSGGWLVMRQYHDLAVEWCRQRRLSWRFSVAFPGGCPVVTRVR